MSADGKCEVCGINARQAEMRGWHVCTLCIATFVEETDASDEAWDWWAAQEDET